MKDAKVPHPSDDPRRFTAQNGEPDDLERRFEDLFRSVQALKGERRAEVDALKFRMTDIEKRLWQIEQRLTSIEQS